MPPTALRAHIAMVTSSSTTPSRAFVWFKAFKALSTVPGNKAAAGSLAPRTFLRHLDGDSAPESVVVVCGSETQKSKREERALGTFSKQTGHTPSPPSEKRSKASVMAMVHCLSIRRACFDL